MLTCTRSLYGKCLAAVLGCAAFAPWVYAQETVEETHADAKVEEIIVTGSRIKRTNYDGPQPVVVFDRVYLEATGFKDVAEFGRYLPQSHQTLPESSAQYAAELAEASQFNLRGLGADSTLTLVNGLRVAPYGQTLFGDPFTDVSAIPMAAVERIEVLKDGASAIYGADAVAGVVNIILRDDFDGTEVTAGYKVTSRGDNATWNVDLFHGGQHGAFHYMLGLFYEDREPLYNRDRKHSADPDFTAIGGYNGRGWFSSPPTIIRYDTFEFHADPACGTDPSIANVVNYEDYPDESSCHFNHNQYDMMYVDKQRASGSLRAGYEFGNGAHLFADVLYSHVDSFVEQAPPPIPPRYPDTLFGAPEVPAEHPNNPFGVPVVLAYRVMDAGQRQYDASSRQHRVTLGLEGQVGAWAWNASLLDSANRFDRQHRNLVLLNEFQAALQGMGGPNRDQYYNPFGWMPENDPAVIAGFKVTPEEANKTSEQALDISASTTFGSPPGGPLGLALGAQRRRQELDESSDDYLAKGLVAGSNISFLVADVDRDIRAAYAELSLPVMKSLELQLAARYEHYSDFGDETNPKVAVRWQPSEQLALRASWGTSFHAPDFIDLYQSPVERVALFDDTPRCELTGLDIDCDWFPYDVLDEGNPDLGPEVGDSWYAGLVWTPTFAPGLAADIGYWRFDYDDRTWSVGGQFILDNLPADNPYIERAQPTPEEAAAGIPGRILLVHETTLNLAHQESDGWDVDLRYGRQTAAAGEFNIRLDYTYTNTFDVTLPETFDYVEYSKAGKYWDGPIPRHRGNVSLGWHTGRHDLNGTFRYAGKYQNEMEFLPVDGEESDIPFIVDDRLTLDLQYALHMDRLNGATLRVGCQNCSDEDPPFTHSTSAENIHEGRGLIWYANWTQPFD